MPVVHQTVRVFGVCVPCCKCHVRNNMSGSQPVNQSVSRLLPDEADENFLDIVIQSSIHQTHCTSFCFTVSLSQFTNVAPDSLSLPLASLYVEMCISKINHQVSQFVSRSVNQSLSLSICPSVHQFVQYASQPLHTRTIIPPSNSPFTPQCLSTPTFYNIRIQCPAHPLESFSTIISVRDQLQRITW